MVGEIEDMFERSYLTSIVRFNQVFDHLLYQD